MERLETHERVPEVLLEKASEADMEALIGIEKEVPRTEVYSPMLSEEAWREELSQHDVYLIKVDGKPVGSIAYAEKSSDHVYISGLIVIPEYQGRGIATEAMKQVMAKYPDVARMDLVTHPQNPALHLYESLGFKVEKLVENYWGEGKPRLVLALNKEKE